MRIGMNGKKTLTGIAARGLLRFARNDEVGEVKQPVAAPSDVIPGFMPGTH